VDGVILTCLAAGEARLSLVNIYHAYNEDAAGYYSPVITAFDTQIIHQIPEPMTMALLCIGGLFLRRRK
jgi:hypothetical protein